MCVTIILKGHKFYGLMGVTGRKKGKAQMIHYIIISEINTQ